MNLKVNLKKDSYQIIIKRGALDNVKKLLSLDRKVLIVTDDGVPKEYAEKIAKASKYSKIITIKSGEESKNIENYKLLLSAMLENSFTRKDAVVAVGGGVIGDLAGFVASSYMRGVDFYNIPTTFLSQVDSSIGGKVAIDFDGYKNAVGAFYQPKKVIIDPDTLKTLSLRQLYNGVVESIKMALTFDKKLFVLLCDQQNLNDNLEEIIIRSLKIKKRVVEKDVKEKRLRKVLNFGHTIGHAIESLYIGQLLHGECVALGMLCFINDKDRQKLEEVLIKYQQKTKVDANIEKITSIIKHDKKANDSTITVVKVPTIGKFTLEELSIDEISKHVGEIL